MKIEMKSLLSVAALAIAFANPSFAADATHGEELFLACAACHNDMPDALGPNLAGVVGREAGTRDDFRYSPAMQRSGIVWTEENLRAYLMDPQGTVRGNRMPFPGYMDAADAEDVVTYLQSLQ
jgi:cytochrome c2